MRRLVLILLMMLLPLQSVWSAAAAACMHEPETTTSHFGHHKAHHDEASRDGATGDSRATTIDIDHHHALSVNPVPSMPALPVFVATEDAGLPQSADRYSNTLITGLERPPKKLAEVISARSVGLRVTQFL